MMKLMRSNALMGWTKPSMPSPSQPLHVVRVLESEHQAERLQEGELDPKFASRQRLMYREECEEFLPEAAGILNEYMMQNLDENRPVCRQASPDDLEEAFTSTSGISLSLEGEQLPEDLGSLSRAFKTALDYSVRTGHDLFFNQLYARPEPMGVAGDWLAAATSTNVHIYEVSPVFTLMETEVLKKLASYIGGDYSKPQREEHADRSAAAAGTSTSCSEPNHAIRSNTNSRAVGGAKSSSMNWDGLLVPGGAVANLYALILAQNKYDPERKERGAAGGPVLVAFCSEHAHFSFEKAAHATGLGSRNLIKVKTDHTGAMCMTDLEEKINQALQQGKRPFFVGATSGTTVRGAFDPLVSCSELCKRYDMWLHVDGAWGAAALLSEKHRGLLSGVHEADSVAWSAHKIMGMAMQCSAIFVKGESLARVNGTGAEYLFQPDRPTAGLDIGDKTIMCGRRAEAVKLWLTWKRVGDQGWAQRVDHAVDLAETSERIVLESFLRGTSLPSSPSPSPSASTSSTEEEGVFVPVFPRSFMNVCFWYVPPSMRPLMKTHGTDPRRWPKELQDRLHRVAPSIKKRMLEAGDAMISFQPQGEGVPNFFRLVFANAGRISPAQVQRLFNRIDSYGAGL